MKRGHLEDMRTISKLILREWDAVI